MTASALLGLGSGRLEHTEELNDPAHEEPFLVDLDPHAGRCREYDVIAWVHRHLDPGLLPPVEPRPNREHDPLLRRWVVSARRDDEAGPPHPIRIELLDHDLVE
jgi:hypothetical protein